METNEGHSPESPIAPNPLLYNQRWHVSEGIRRGEEFGRLRCIPTNPDKKIWSLTKQQKAYVRKTGLHHLAEIDRIQIDHALITALAERWRPETNSFHFPSGEATVTLEDVAYIYGLPLDGPLVAGRTFSGKYVVKTCEEILGLTPRKKIDYVGITLKFKWLEDNFKATELEKKKDDKDYKDFEIRATRAYLFFLVSDQIVTQTSGARGPAYLLELFKEFKPYAWGPACLANLYRMLTNASLWNAEKKVEGDDKDDQKCDIEGHQLRTPTGPLQLLQLWAYTRMSIGKCPMPKDSWKGDIQYPLFKTWRRRLPATPPLSTVKEVRLQLNNLKLDGFIWQPYERYNKKFHSKVSKVDRNLIGSATVLVFYWIVERHNTWRVMKQFGLKQIVPPPFTMPLSRPERTYYTVVDYNQKLDDEIKGLWAARDQLGLKGEVCTAAEQSAEYMEWYSDNTITFIGRGVEPDQPNVIEKEAANTDGAEKQDEPTVPERHARDLVERIERSFKRAVHRNTPLEKLALSIGKKLGTFKSGFGTNWTDFSFDGCSSSQSDEDVGNKEITIIKTHRKRPAVKTPVKKMKMSRTKTAQVEETPLLKIEGSDSMHLSPVEVQEKAEELLEESVQGPSDPPDQVSGQGWGVQPSAQLVCTPSVSRALFSSPVPVSSSSTHVVSAPKASLVSLVWRIKRLPRMRKIPIKFEDYAHSLVQDDYVLSECDKFFLKGFKEYYVARKDELEQICTLVKADDLKKILDEGTWMDTNIIYFYFEILRDGCDSCFIADPSVCSWWDGGSDSAIEAVFGKQGHRVWDAKESRTLVFVVYHRSHFTLLVGYVDEQKWEFYNSMEKDRRSMKHAEKFVGWLNAWYSHFGWNDPFMWQWLERTDIPRQENSNDCGVFAMAFATHCVHRLPFKFSQSHIPYFRSKIVVEIFKRSWQLNANRLGLTHLTSDSPPR